jgi:vacuolar ATPase assembly integral membrane protein VMA21
MFKLLFFTAAMILFPLVTYWFTLNYVFQGTHPITVPISCERILTLGYNYTKAGITAIAAAHVVLFSYIYVALKEDSEDKQMKKQQ